MTTHFPNPLDALNERLAAYADGRAWVSVTFKRVCRNCGSEALSEPQLMRREAMGFSNTSSPLPAGIVPETQTVPSTFARCEKCGGSRPLRDDILHAVDGSTNDRDLAQRVGRLLSDFVRKTGRIA